MVKARLGTDRPFFIDIDGTLTDFPQQGGNVIEARLEQIRTLVKHGTQIVIWSGGGTAYVKKFCKENNLNNVIMIGKPELIVDDNPNIRPPSFMPLLTPEDFFSNPMFKFEE